MWGWGWSKVAGEMVGEALRTHRIGILSLERGIVSSKEH